MEGSTGWRTRAAAITRAALVLAGLIGAWLGPSVAVAGNRNSACGGPLQRHCCAVPPETSNLQACDSGRVSIIGGPGAGEGPPIFPLGPACSLGTCYSTVFPTSCGDRGERACTLDDHYLACKSGLRNTDDVCRHPDDLFPSNCGHENQPACTLDVQVLRGITSCQSAFREIPFPGGTCVRLDGNGFPPSCGNLDQSACTLDVQLLLGIRSCSGSLAEVPFPGGTCIELDDDGFPDFCGGDDERPCNLNEHIPSCKVDLEETDTHPTSGNIEVKCLDAFPPACGRNGQRPCTVFDELFLPACKNGLRQLPDDFGVCGTDPIAWGETDAHEPARGRPRTVFYIHGRGGDLFDFAGEPNLEVFRRMLLEAPNIRKVYGVDWNNAGAPPRKVMTRELRLLEPSCLATPATCSFTTEDLNWGAVEFDHTNFKITEVAHAAAEAIKRLPTEGDITIVAASFGGAMARQLVYRHYDELRNAGKRIAEVVNIAVPHRGGLAGDLSLADGRSAELQKYFACLRTPPFFDADSDHTGCEIGTWVEWMKNREDGILAPGTPLFIDDRGYPQIRWITLAANGKRLDLGALITSLEGVVGNPLAFALHGDANELLAMARDWHNDSTVVPFPDSDGTITVRSAFGIATDECYPFYRHLPPSGTSSAEVVPDAIRTYTHGIARSAVCYHQGARVDPRVKEDADYETCVDDFPEELCALGHGDLGKDVDLQDFILASLSLLGDTNGDGVVDGNDLRAEAGPDRSLECSGALTEVTLDASGSFVPGAVTLTYTWSGPFGTVSGANATVALPVGQHALTLEVAGGGHRSTDEVLVTIGDTTAPQFGGAAGFTVEATAVPGTPFAFTPEASDLCGPVTVQVSSELSLFPLGSTDLTLTATDPSGNATSQVVTVTVVDTTPPEIAAPPGVSAEANAVFSVVEIGGPTATDIFPVTLSNDAPAGFPLGDTFVSWTATDANGNHAGTVQTVTVVDTTAPQLVAPADLSTEANAVSSTVALGTAIATDIFAVTVGNDAPAAFPLGATRVTWTATDPSGNAVSAVQAVTVVDTTLPTLTLPPDVVVTATGGLTPVDIGTATATDIFGATVSDDGPASFPVGLTLVTWTAVDGNGNRASATQRIQVVYRFDGFSGPIQPGGVYKANRTLPLKFRLSFSDDAPVTTAVARLTVSPLGPDGASGDPLDIDSGDEADDGGVFRYTDDHYHLNVKTQGWSTGRYRLAVSLDDGRGYAMEIRLR